MKQTRMKPSGVLIGALLLLAAGLLLVETRKGIARSSFTAPSFQMVMTRWQPNSPAQIISITTTTASFFGGAVVLNTGDAVITEVQFGWVMEVEQGGAKRAVRAFPGRPIGVLIAPGRTAAVSQSEWTTADVLQYAVDRGLGNFRAKVGVVSVKSSDGKSFNYNLAGIGDFPPDVADSRIESLFDGLDKNELDRQIKLSTGTAANGSPLRRNSAATIAPLPIQLRPATFTVRSLFPPPATHFAGTAAQQNTFCCKKTDNTAPPCATSNSRVYCSVTNGGQTCTVSFCGPSTCCGTTCACQTCGVAPDCT